MLERWPQECRRFRRKPIRRERALVTAKGSRRAKRGGFLEGELCPDLNDFWFCVDGSFLLEFALSLAGLLSE